MSLRRSIVFWARVFSIGFLWASLSEPAWSQQSCGSPCVTEDCTPDGICERCVTGGVFTADGGSFGPTTPPNCWPVDAWVVDTNAPAAGGLFPTQSVLARYFAPNRVGEIVFIAPTPSGYRPQSAPAAGALSNVIPGYYSSCLGSFSITFFPPYAEDADMREPPCDQRVSSPSQNVGRPVSVTTGNVWLDHTDAILPGVGPEIALRRSYNSLNAFKNRGGSFGPGWHHSFERTITVPSSTVPGLILRGGDGAPTYFHDNNNDLTYIPFAPVTDESWIVKQPPNNDFVRHFRGGGSEEYNTSGRLTALVDRWGNRTTLTWQGSLLTTIADEGGRALSLGYEENVLRTLSGPAGLIASYEYQNGLLSRVTYADEQQSGYSFTYWTDNGRRLLERISDLESPAKTLEFHEYIPGTGKGRTSELGGGQERLELDYSPVASSRPLRTKVTDARNNVTSYHYREVAGLRRVVKIEGPCAGCGGGGGQAVQEWTYDAKGHVTSHKDGEGNVTTYTYDAATGDLLSESRKPDPNTTHTTTYTYHPDGRLATREDPRGALTTWSYSTEAGEETETVEQEVDSQRTRTTVIRRNGDGKPRLVIDPREKETQLFYTPLGDLDHIVDPAGKETEFTYDSMGRRTQVINPPVSPVPALEPRYEYNARGAVLKIVDPTDPNKFTQFTYDRGGRRREVRDALQRRTEYVYDTYGRLEFVKRWLDAISNQTTEYHYDFMSNLEWIKDARANQTAFEYDGYNRVKKVIYLPDSNAPFEEFTYDGAGRLKTRKDRRGVITTYSYDGLGRLTSKTYVGGPVATAPVTFGYDGAGNLTLAGDGSTTLSWIHNLTGEPESATQQQLVDGQSVVTTLAYGYDEAGSRTSLDAGGGFALTYDYDVVGRLWHILRGSDTFTFGYDDASRRRALTYPNGVVTNLTPDNLSRLERPGGRAGCGQPQPVRLRLR